MDYWGACAATSLCKAKCFLEIEEFESVSFDQGVLDDFSGGVEIVTRDVESHFFLDMNSDAYTPFNILSMVQLESCELVCGLQTIDVATEFISDTNKDTCVAIVGVSEIQELTVEKYCVPKAFGEGVRKEARESWTVTGSAQFIDSVIEVRFADTVKGDTLIVHRDNSGSTNPGPKKDFITVHPRSIQQDTLVFSEFYSTQQDLAIRLKVMELDDCTLQLDSGVSATGVTSMYVLPATAGRATPWVFVRVNTLGGDVEGVTNAYQADFCWPIDVNYLISSRGKQRAKPSRCSNNVILERMETLFMVPISMPSHSQSVATIVFMPTRDGYNLCQMDFTLGTGAVRQSGVEACFSLGNDFISSTGMPSAVGGRQGGVIGNFGSDQLQRAAVLRNNVVSRISRTVSQNTESFVVSSVSPLLIFVGNDPSARVSWLSQSRIVVVGSKASGTRHVSHIAKMEVLFFMFRFLPIVTVVTVGTICHCRHYLTVW